MSGGEAAAVSVRVHGEAKNNPGPFRSTARNISDRSHTSASALWQDVPNVGGGTVVRTGDLSGIVSELVGRGGWQSGNRMVFLFEHASGSGTRSFKSYENDSNAAARLVVEYDDVAGSVAGALAARPDIARDRMISIVDSLVADGKTPLVDALWEASLYYRGQPVDYGKTRGPKTRSHRRVSHPPIVRRRHGRSSERLLRGQPERLAVPERDDRRRPGLRLADGELLPDEPHRPALGRAGRR